MKQKLMRLFSLAVFLAGVAVFSLVNQSNAEQEGCTCPVGGPMQPCCNCGCQPA